ncbi:apoptosis-associated speck-like protein containing a CARD [Leptodactylus fuscus]|uniref:apoptosis-associated speck-like protein containing a CARD n=1 Tax=Leptodactylus fuscus TaxID=238119 RepID=UPI003F4E468F
MEKTVRDVLVQGLENLERKSFKRFKNKLNDVEIKKGFSKIPKSKLEEADTEDVVDLIRRYYKDSYGIEVTLNVLEAIDERQEAEKLRNDLTAVNSCPSREPSNGNGNGTNQREPSRDVLHFVDRHRTALITRVVLVDPILDDLLQDKLLTAEAYGIIRSKSLSTMQMRELYSFIQSWGNEDKDRLLESLRKHNMPLIRDLEGN